MNSVLRTLDLTTNMVAPAVTGQLFHFLGHAWTAAFIAGWNLVSMAVEYALLDNIYRWVGIDQF